MENAARLRNGRAPKRPTIENDHPTIFLNNDDPRHPGNRVEPFPLVPCETHRLPNEPNSKGTIDVDNLPSGFPRNVDATSRRRRVEIRRTSKQHEDGRRGTLKFRASCGRRWVRCRSIDQLSERFGESKRRHRHRWR